MTEILARCGYRCDLYPAFAANIHCDEDRRKVSDGWFKYLGFRVEPEKIHCESCFDNHKTLDNECPVLPCVMKKGIKNCGFCREMPCDKLKTRMVFLEERHLDLSQIPTAEYNTFIRPYMSKDRLMKIFKNNKISYL